MQLLLFLVAGCGLSYLLTAHRRCDLFTLAFVAACVYFLPGFVGGVPDGINRETRVPIERETYAVMITVLTAILAGAWCWDPAGQTGRRDAEPVSDPVASWVALSIAGAGLVMAVRSGGDALFSANKSDVLEATSRWFMLLGFGASLSAVLTFLQRQWKLFAVSCGLLLFTVYIGFRSSLAMALMGVFLVHFHRQGPQRLVTRNRPTLLIMAGMTVAFFAYKCVYQLVKLGEYGLAVESLGDPEFYYSAVIGSEPFATQMVLNEVLRTDFQTDAAYIVQSVMAQLTLFSGELGFRFVSFNDLFQPQLFSEVHYGLAANIWAQMLAAGGWPLFLCFLTSFVGSLRLGSIWLANRRLTTRAGVALAGAYWAFYIHRNDLGFELSLMKRVLLVWFLVVCVAEAVHRLGMAYGRRARPSAPRGVVRPGRPVCN